MSTDQRSPSTANAVERSKSGPASRPMGIREAFRAIRKGIVVMWWSFFDWLAAISWKALLLVAFLEPDHWSAPIQAAPTLAVFLVVTSSSSMVISGGQAQAELARPSTPPGVRNPSSSSAPW